MRDQRQADSTHTVQYKIPTLYRSFTDEIAHQYFSIYSKKILRDKNWPELGRVNKETVTQNIITPSEL